MKKYSFYGFIAGQLLLVLILEYVFYKKYLMGTLEEHLIMAGTLYLVTALTYFLSKKMIHTDPQYFIQTIIGSTSVKLVIYIGVIAVLLYFYSNNPISYIFFFFVCYLMLTTTEILYLIRTLRSRQNKAA